MVRFRHLIIDATLLDSTTTLSNHQKKNRNVVISKPWVRVGSTALLQPEVRGAKFGYYCIMTVHTNLLHFDADDVFRFACLFLLLQDILAERLS